MGDLISLNFSRAAPGPGYVQKNIFFNTKRLHFWCTYNFQIKYDEIKSLPW